MPRQPCKSGLEVKVLLHKQKHKNCNKKISLEHTAMQKQYVSRRQAPEKLLNTIGEEEIKKKKKKPTTWYFYMSIRNCSKGKLTIPSAIKNVKAPVSQILLVGEESAPAPLQSHLQLHMALKTHIPHNPTSPLLVFIRMRTRIRGLAVCTHLSADIHVTQ